MRLDLGGLRILVTGGSRGLGAAIAATLSESGAQVASTSRFPPDAPIPEGIRHLLGDVADPQERREVVAALAEAWGGVDVLVHNAALSAPVADLAGWREASAEVTLRSSTWPLVDLIRQIEAATGVLPRRVVVISSLGAALCPPRYAYLGVSKAALEALARYLAVDLAPQVRLLTLRLGFLDTEGLRAMFAADSLARVEALGGFVPLPEAAALVAALCSGLLDATTGQVLVADNGLSLCSPLQFLEAR